MKKRFVLAALAALFIGPAAQACPDYNLYGDTYELNGADLVGGQYVDLRAGGDQSITGCGIRFGSDRGRGYVTRAPDFSIKLHGMGRYKIRFTVRSACDSILLINTGAANWYYDDDDAGNLDATILLTRPSNGWMDIWVGTHDGSVCDARLYLETFRR